MIETHIELLMHALPSVPCRRHLLQGLAGAGLAWGLARLPEAAVGKKKRKKKRRKRNGNGISCTWSGERCTRRDASCQERYCLKAPITIVATWAVTADHDTYLFVPPQNATTGPFPFIHQTCDSSTACKEAYPFACIDGHGTMSGEITTIYELLPGAYEYWIGLQQSTPVGAVIVVLKDATGRIVRQWASPANPSTEIQAAWHVFDVDGDEARIYPIEQLIADRTPRNVHEPDTNVCPD